MPQKLRVQGPATQEELDEGYRQSRHYRDRERLLAMRLAQEGGRTVEQIAKIVGRGARSVYRWIAAYRQGGIEGLLKRRPTGHTRPRLSEEDKELLVEGLRAGRWKTAREVQLWLQQERGVDLKLSGVYSWLYKLKAKWKVPRKSHEKKDPESEQEFKNEFVSKLEGLDIPPGKSVRIWVEDEHRYGLISCVRRYWGLRGHRARVPYNQKYEWGYVYAAIEVQTGKTEILYTPTVCLAWTLVFLNQLVASDPESIHVVMWDQAGFHHGPGDSSLPESVRVVSFPPYCPELNPVERLWDPVTRKVANQAWKTLAAIQVAITGVLRQFWEEPARCLRLLGDNWLTRGVASFIATRKTAIIT